MSWMSLFAPFSTTFFLKRHLQRAVLMPLSLRTRHHSPLRCQGKSPEESQAAPEMTMTHNDTQVTGSSNTKVLSVI